MIEFVLLHSPLVGPSSLLPTAERLRSAGAICHVPTASSGTTMDIPWHRWPERVAEELPVLNRPVFVGHSMAGLLAARLSADLDAAGVICLDAALPPSGGRVEPVEPAFRDFLRTLPIEAGCLPGWTEWWPLDVFVGTGIAPELRARFLAEQPRVPLSWFDDAFEMHDWSSLPSAYIRTSPAFIGEARRAERRGWPVVKLDGTHLHPAIAPDETASAILECVRRMKLV